MARWKLMGCDGHRMAIQLCPTMATTPVDVATPPADAGNLASEAVDRQGCESIIITR